MSKWKCEICNNEFDNFQAQGFGGTIYCPLCYFKELYRKTELERERLNNIINELEKELNKKIEAIKTIKDMLGEEAKIVNPHIEVLETEYKYFLDKLKELKENNNV